MSETLVICVGNKARGDDGVARRVAARLSGALAGDVDLRSVPQLDIVLAEDVARASLVVFVDAECREAPPVHTDALHPDATTSNAHALQPSGLLALAATLYGAEPQTWLVSVAAPQMGHEEGLSATAEAASVEAASEVLRLVRSRHRGT